MFKKLKELFKKWFAKEFKKESKPKPEPVIVDKDIAVIEKWTTPSTFKWNDRKPDIHRIKNAPVNISVSANKNTLSYSIKDFVGKTYPTDLGARVETYTFKKCGELYIWKDWGANTSGDVDSRWIKIDHIEKEGWNGTGMRDGMSLEDFDSIVIHKNLRGDVYARSKVFNKKDVV